MAAGRILAQAFLCLAFAGMALAEEAGSRPDPLRFGTEDRYLKFAPFLQFEAGRAESSPRALTDDIDRTDGQFRRARLYTTFGYDEISGQFTFDLASDPTPSIIYAFIDYAVTDALTIELGQQDGLFSLQDLSGSRSALFNEDGQNETLQSGDYVGASLRYGAENFSLSGGVYGSDINIEPFGEGWTVMARGTYAPVNTDEAALHFGLGLMDREDLEAPLSFSGDTGAALFDVSTVKTGGFDAPKTYRAANPEVAGTFGPYSFAGEYTIGRVKDAERGGATLQGGYASVLAFLTDDHRVYDASTGTFDRVKPKNPVKPSGGYGAVEIGARLDWLDLTDAGPEAGEEVAGTAIVNWYLLDQLRFSASHTYTHLTDGPDEGADFQATLLRFWITF